MNSVFKTDIGTIEVEGYGQETVNELRKYLQKETGKKFVHIKLEGFQGKEFIPVNIQSTYKI